MRVTDDWNLQDQTAKFCGDIDKGCAVQLPGGSVINTEFMGDNDTPFYEYLDGENGELIRREVFYPGWASW